MRGKFAVLRRVPNDARQQVEPHQGERTFPQFARGLALSDEAPVLRGDRARIPAVGEVIDGAARDRIAFEDRPFDRRDATVARQQRQVVADPAQTRARSASSLTRACVCAATIKSVPSAIALPGTLLGFSRTCTGMPAASAATASRSSAAGTTTCAISTPSFTSAWNTIAPKYRDPTSVHFIWGRGTGGEGRKRLACVWVLSRRTEHTPEIGGRHERCGAAGSCR